MLPSPCLPVSFAFSLHFVKSTSPRSGRKRGRRCAAAHLPFLLARARLALARACRSASTATTTTIPISSDGRQMRQSSFSHRSASRISPLSSSSRCFASSRNFLHVQPCNIQLVLVFDRRDHAPGGCRNISWRDGGDITRIALPSNKPGHCRSF